VALSPSLCSSLWFWCLLGACISHILRCILGVVSSCRLLLISVLVPFCITHGFFLVVTRRGDNKSFIVPSISEAKDLCLRGDDLRVLVYLGCEPLSRTLRRASLVRGLPRDFRFAYELRGYVLWAIHWCLSVFYRSCDLRCGRRMFCVVLVVFGFA